MAAEEIGGSGKKRKRAKADKEHPTEPGSTENDQTKEDTPAAEDHGGLSPEKKTQKKKKRRDSEEYSVEPSSPPITEEDATADGTDKKKKKKKKKERRDKEEEADAKIKDGDEEQADEENAMDTSTSEVPLRAQSGQPSPASESMARTSGLEMVRRLLSGHTRSSDLTASTKAAPGTGKGGPEKEKAKPAVVVEEQDEATRRTASDMAREWGLDKRLVPQLDRHGVASFFAVQCRVLPYLISTQQADLVRDVVVSAPTGSGKTLVYVLALLQGLRHRRIVRLRGLVVVPNRDLALQVLSEFEKYAGVVGLKVGLAIGQTDFAKEQADIIGPVPLSGVAGGVSAVDILVATPGRLMDHMERTPGFTLQHLTFLVIDEVDRLVTQSYQDWVHKVYDAAYGQVPGEVLLTPDSQPCHVLRPATVRVRPESKLDKPILPALGTVPLRKLLFSATVTSNPQKLALLDLRNPRYFGITSVAAGAHPQGEEGPTPAARGGGKFSTPESLAEFCVGCSTEKKPLALLHLLAHPSLCDAGLVLIFTSSVDSTHRLCRLLHMCLSADGAPGGTRAVEEFSSALTQAQRGELIKRCTQGQVRVLVSSDGMARGIDLPNVAVVVNYDVPSHAKTYVHRVGRTARAGRKGASYSLVKRGQEHQFQRMRTSVDDKRVQPFSLKMSGGGNALAEAWVAAYRPALRRLKTVLELERQGRLKPYKPFDEIELDDESSEEVDEEEDPIETPDADEGGASAKAPSGNNRRGRGGGRGGGRK